MDKLLFDLICVVVLTIFIIYFDTGSSKVMMFVIYLGGILSGVIAEKYFNKKRRKS